MKTLFSWLAVLSFAATGCKESIIEPSDDSNLITNWSFEIDHEPTLRGWRPGNPQTIELVREAPPGGGSWSLQLTADWAPTGAFVYRPITNVKNGDIVTLSAFVRATSPSGSRGIIILAVGPNIRTEHAISATSSDTVWKQISVTDTLALAANDTLWVILSSPITEIVPFRQLFDLVKLQKL